MSSPPNSSTARATSASHCARSVMSVTAPTATPPAATTASTVPATASGSRSPATILAPCAASCVQIDRPRPGPAPDTIAVFPSSSMVPPTPASDGVSLRASAPADPEWQSDPVSYDFFDSGVAVDPFPLFADLREHAPVHRTEFGYWYVSRYDDCHAVLRDTRLGPGTGVPDSFGLSDGPLYDVMTSWLMALGGAEHARVRRLVSRAFTPRAVEQLRPAVEQLAVELVGGLVARGGGDIVAELAFPLPMQVVRMLFGVDADEWDREVAARFDPARADPAGGFLAPMRALVDYFGPVVEARRGTPGDDVFSLLMQPDDDGDTLTDLELVANAVLFVTAGFETTMGLVT